jgi:hypothetical protein
VDSMIRSRTNSGSNDARAGSDEEEHAPVNLTVTVPYVRLYALVDFYRRCM